MDRITYGPLNRACKADPGSGSSNPLSPGENARCFALWSYHPFIRPWASPKGDSSNIGMSGSVCVPLSFSCFGMRCLLFFGPAPWCAAPEEPDAPLIRSPSCPVADSRGTVDSSSRCSQVRIPVIIPMRIKSLHQEPSFFPHAP